METRFGLGTLVGASGVLAHVTPRAPGQQCLARGLRGFADVSFHALQSAVKQHQQ
jgi:hypothetical protein